MEVKEETARKPEGNGKVVNKQLGMKTYGGSGPCSVEW
jgi:hypothetical protein